IFLPRVACADDGLSRASADELDEPPPHACSIAPIAAAKIHWNALPVTPRLPVRHARTGCQEDVLQMRTVCNHNSTRDDRQPTNPPLASASRTIRLPGSL